MTSGRTVLAAKKNDLKMQLVPGGFRESSLEISLGLADIARLGQPPAPGQSMDVSIDWKRGLTKGLSDYHRSRLVAYSSQFLQTCQIIRDYSLMALTQLGSEAHQIPGFLGCQTQGPNDLQNLSFLKSSQGFWGWGQSKERRSHFIDLFVGGLSRQQNRH